MRGSRHHQLTAAWLNIMGAGIVSGGAISQLAAIANGASVPLCVMLALASLLVGTGLHAAARRQAARED